jgi:hypothetical protein
LTDVGLAAGQKIEVRWQVDVEMETAEDPGDSNTAAEATEAAAAEGKQQTKIQSSVRVGLSRHSMLSDAPFKLLSCSPSACCGQQTLLCLLHPAVVGCYSEGVHR